MGIFVRKDYFFVPHPNRDKMPEVHETVNKYGITFHEEKRGEDTYRIITHINGYSILPEDSRDLTKLTEDQLQRARSASNDLYESIKEGGPTLLFTDGAVISKGAKVQPQHAGHENQRTYTGWAVYLLTFGKIDPLKGFRDQPLFE